MFLIGIELYQSPSSLSSFRTSQLPSLEFILYPLRYIGFYFGAQVIQRTCGDQRMGASSAIGVLVIELRLPSLAANAFTQRATPLVLKHCSSVWVYSPMYNFGINTVVSFVNIKEKPDNKLSYSLQTLFYCGWQTALVTCVLQEELVNHLIMT